MQTLSNRGFLLLALVADSLTLLTLLLIMPVLRPLLSEPSGTSTILLALVYIPFLAGMFMLRKLQPIPPATGKWLAPGVRGVLAGFFGLVLMVVLAWQLGYFESFSSADPFVLGEGEAAAYFVFAPGAWIGVSMLYILFLAFPVNETVGPQSNRYGVFTIFGLLTSALMLVILVAQGQAIVPPTNPALWLTIGLIGLLALFVPPRLLYLSRLFQLPGREAVISLVSLAIVVVTGAWLMVGV